MRGILCSGLGQTKLNRASFLKIWSPIVAADTGKRETTGIASRSLAHAWADAYNSDLPNCILIRISLLLQGLVRCSPHLLARAQGEQRSPGLWEGFRLRSTHTRLPPGCPALPTSRKQRRALAPLEWGLCTGEDFPRGCHLHVWRGRGPSRYPKRPEWSRLQPPAAGALWPVCSREPHLILCAANRVTGVCSMLTCQPEVRSADVCSLVVVLWLGQIRHPHRTIFGSSIRQLAISVFIKVWKPATQGCQRVRRSTMPTYKPLEIPALPFCSEGGQRWLCPLCFFQQVKAPDVVPL